MKKFLLILALFFMLGCASSSFLVNDYDYRFRNPEQIDSVIKVEHLPSGIENYKCMTFYQDSAIIKQYVYIRKTDSLEIIYTITDMDSLFRIRKKTLNY